jgi:hypothetical protein
MIYFLSIVVATRIISSLSSKASNYKKSCFINQNNTIMIQLGHLLSNKNKDMEILVLPEAASSTTTATRTATTLRRPRQRMTKVVAVATEKTGMIFLLI